MNLDNFKLVLYRNQPDGRVADVPAIEGCYALMPTKEEALAEIQQVFEMIAAEYCATRAVNSSGWPPCDDPDPWGREIGPPLFHRILDQLGITADEFGKLKK